jgi:hypothetical protein
LVLVLVGDGQEVVNRPSPAVVRERKWFAEEQRRSLRHRDSYLRRSLRHRDSYLRRSLRLIKIVQRL